MREIVQETGVLLLVASLPAVRRVVSHRPVQDLGERQTLVTTGIEDALAAGLVDEFVLYQVSVLLGGGRRFFQDLPDHVGSVCWRSSRLRV